MSYIEMVINGYTVIAHEWDPTLNRYVFLAARRTGPENYEYVVARLNSLDDAEWVNGRYWDDVLDAAEDYHAIRCRRHDH